jgi:uncharacterized membrane protein
MNKLEYLDALRRALAGVAPEAAAKTLAYYEQRFVDGEAAGRSEQQICAELDEPRKIAMTLRANTHMRAFEQKKNPANLARVFISLIGLAIFNLFMVVPAVVYSALLVALYACALVFYLGGVAVSAAGLSGTNELVLDGPLRHVVMDGKAFTREDNVQTHISFSEAGINIFEDPASEDKDKADATVSDGPDDAGTSRMFRHAEALAGHGLRISTDMDSSTRKTQTMVGLCMVLAGIIMLLLGLVVTKYTFIGLRRYAEMNLSLLRGH